MGLLSHDLITTQRGGCVEKIPQMILQRPRGRPSLSHALQVQPTWRLLHPNTLDELKSTKLGKLAQMMLCTSIQPGIAIAMHMEKDGFIFDPMNTSRCHSPHCFDKRRGSKTDLWISTFEASTAEPAGRS